jgi:hypothetical protein
MTWPSSPEWLLEFQRNFGQALRTPLDTKTGTLQATIADYPPDLVRATKSSHNASPAERLAVYQRQYWFRLFTVLHAAYPLVARLLGFWQLNAHAARYLGEQPPRSWDIDDICVGFEAFLVQAINGPSALHDAAALDAAYHRVFRAPAERAYHPDAADAARLLVSRLRLSRTAELVHETYPVSELRPRALSLRGEETLPLPSPLAAARSHLLVREQLRLKLVRLEPAEAELLRLLGLLPVGAAIAELEARSTPDERSILPGRVQRWLARSVQLGVWSGLSEAQK